MESALFKFHTVSECHCCGAVLIVDNSNEVVELSDGESFRKTGPIMEAYKEHVEANPQCKAWHDALPTFEELRGILRDHV